MKQRQKNKKFRGILRKLSAFLAIAVFALTLSGCSGRNTTGTGSVTLYWWRSQEDANKQILETLITKFQQDNPSIKVKVVLKNPDTYLKEATEALASNQTIENAPDIMSVNAYDLPKVAAQLAPAPDNLFADPKAKVKDTRNAVEVAKEQLVPAAYKAVVLNDPKTASSKLYGLPIGIDSLVLFRNREILSDAATNLKTENKLGQQYSAEELKILKKKIQDPALTWAALAEIIPLIKVQDGAQVSRAAISLGSSINVERSYDILQTIMMQNGTQLVSGELDSATFNQARAGAAASANPGEKALGFYLRFSNPNDPVYTWNNDMPNSFDAFKNEQSAMMIHYGSAYNILINEAKSLKNKIDIQPLPQAVDPKAATSTNQVKTMAKMWVETAPSAKGDVKRQQAAWRFINYVTSKGSSSYLSAMKMSSALKKGTDKAKFAALTSQKTTADLWFKGADSMAVDKIFISAIDDAATGKKNPQEALNSAATSTTKILQSSKIKWSTAAATSAVSQEVNTGE